MGVWERRLATLKQLGVNAIRTSHNAPDPAFLDLCDRMGFVVMHELFDVWTARKVPGDYAQFFDQWWERDLQDVLQLDEVELLRGQARSRETVHEATVAKAPEAARISN